MFRSGSKGAGLVSKYEVVGINLLRREPKKLVKKEARIRVLGGKLPFAFDRDTIVILVLVAVFVFSFGGYAWHLSHGIKRKEELLIKKKAELERLREVYNSIKALKEKRRELERMVRVVKELSNGRKRMVRFFEDLEATIPPNSWLYYLELKGKEINLKGYSLEDKGVADFMDNLARLPQVSQCKLDYIKEGKFSGMKVKEFSLRVSLR